MSLFSDLRLALGLPYVGGVVRGFKGDAMTMRVRITASKRHMGARSPSERLLEALSSDSRGDPESGKAHAQGDHADNDKGCRHPG
jgi:hypothetical protein